MNRNLRSKLARRYSYLSWMVLGLVALVLAGCQPTLTIERSIELVPSEIRSVELDPISTDQELKIEATGGSEFHCHVYISGDDDAVDKDIALQKEPAGALGGSLKKAEHSFTVKVPANKQAIVRLEAAAADTVSVKLSIEN
ncbi:MAG: hypothetical protein AAFN77_12370 [Planctomycetota bacterium]